MILFSADNSDSITTAMPGSRSDNPSPTIRAEPVSRRTSRPDRPDTRTTAQPGPPSDNRHLFISNTPSNIFTNTDPNQPTAVVTWTPPTATNIVNNGQVFLTSNYQPGNRFPIGVTTVTYTATDAFNNVKTASFTVTVAGRVSELMQLK